MTTTTAPANLSLQPQEIALAIPNFAGGGAERAAINLAQALCELNVPVRFIVEHANGALAAEALAVAPVDALGATGLGQTVAALREQMRIKPESAYVSFMTRSNILCAGARALLHKKPILIMTEHNNRRRLLRAQKPHRRALSYCALKMAFHHADKTVCVSDGIQEITQTLFSLPPHKLAKIYNPIVTKKMKRIAGRPRPSNRGSRPATIIAAGRLHPQKDFPTLINAAAKLRDHDYDFQLTIFGEGPERLRLEALIQEKNLSAHVSLPGFDSDVLSRIADADLFALSSRWEGFGNVIAEALACGTPVVSTDCESGPREILDNGRLGKLVPVGDADALADAMLETLSARPVIPANAADRFSAEHAAKEYLSIVNTLRGCAPSWGQAL